MFGKLKYGSVMSSEKSGGLTYGDSLASLSKRQWLGPRSARLWIVYHPIWPSAHPNLSKIPGIRSMMTPNSNALKVNRHALSQMEGDSEVMQSHRNCRIHVRKTSAWSLLIDG